MSRQLSLVAAALALWIRTLAMAQAPNPASPCDLVKDPVKYANQIVEVRASLALGFENFTLKTPGCDAWHRNVWVAFGGDDPSSTTSPLNDLPRPPSTLRKLDGGPISLQRDADFDLFRRRLEATRFDPDEGLGCHGDCRLYNMTATFTGVFFPAPADPNGGFGHRGCCHLLVIQRISAVDAERTTVPAGGRFACSTETWNVGVDEAEALARQSDSCGQSGDCRHKVSGEEVEMIAKHWNDSIDLANQGDFPFLMGPSWRSPDHLKAYSFDIEHQDNIHKTGPITGAIGTRVECKAVSPPFPPNTPIGCRALVSKFVLSPSDAKAIQEQVRLGNASWRVGSAESASKEALEEVLRHWGVNPTPDLKLEECGKPFAVNSDEFSWCRWSDPYGMQEFSIEVERLGSLRHWMKWESVPWVIARGQGKECEAE